MQSAYQILQTEQVYGKLTFKFFPKLTKIKEVREDFFNNYKDLDFTEAMTDVNKDQIEQNYKPPESMEDEDLTFEMKKTIQWKKENYLMQFILDEWIDSQPKINVVALPKIPNEEEQDEIMVKDSQWKLTDLQQGSKKFTSDSSILKTLSVKSIDNQISIKIMDRMVVLNRLQLIFKESMEERYAATKDRKKGYFILYIKPLKKKDPGLEYSKVRTNRGRGSQNPRLQSYRPTQGRQNRGNMRGQDRGSNRGFRVGFRSRSQR